MRTASSRFSSHPSSHRDRASRALDPRRERRCSTPCAQGTQLDHVAHPPRLGPVRAHPLRVELGEPEETLPHPAVKLRGLVVEPALGAVAIGGCCRVGPDDIARLRRRLLA